MNFLNISDILRNHWTVIMKIFHNFFYTESQLISIMYYHYSIIPGKVPSQMFSLPSFYIKRDKIKKQKPNKI